MLATPRLLARHAAGSTRPLKRGAPPLNLLPPLPLYRHLLRLHRKKLNSEERIFGDTYLKAEFRRHRDIENPLHIVGFLQQWQQYGDMLSAKAGEEDDSWLDLRRGPEGKEGGVAGDGVGWAMDTLMERMNDQQIGQVWELYNAIQNRNRAAERVEADGEGNEEEVVELDAHRKS
jgi:hypothetical protein